jgi:sugar lactone lactonase YvrE
VTVTGKEREVELLVDAHARIGEGPVWDAALRRLVWLDILNGLVHLYDPVSGHDETAGVGKAVGAAAPRASGGLVLALEDGFAAFDPASEELTPLAPVEADQPGLRMNDGKCDRAGRFWAGSMEWDGEHPVGSLYRLDPDHAVTRVVTGVRISNGLGWSPDGRLMYYIDSPTYRIDVFDFDLGQGSLANRRTLVEVPREWGMPDGMTVDAEGCLWVAFWGGWAVRRLTPDGTLVETLRLPVSQVSSCTFGGPDGEDLYITSATDGLSDEQLRAEPHAGALFRARPGVAGGPTWSFAG